MVLFGPAGVLGDGNVRGDHIRQDPQEPQRKAGRHALGAPELKIEAAVRDAGPVGRFAFLDRRTDRVGPKHDPEPLRIDLSGGDPGVAAGERAGGNAQLGIARHHLQALAIGDKRLRLEVADFPGKLRRHAGQVRFASRGQCRNDLPAGPPRRPPCRCRWG